MISSSGQKILSRLESLTFPSCAAAGRSRRTSSAGLSSRSPWNEGARRWPSCVHSANSTSATSLGSTQTTSPFFTFGIFGTTGNGDSSRRSGSSCSSSSRIVALVEARADVPDPLPLLAAMDAHHQRAEAAAALALALRVAADHELLAPVRLDLQPVAAASALGVARRRALGHHALEPLFLRRLEQRFAVLERAGELDDRIRREQLLEPRPALGQRQVDRRLAVDLEHVEHLVREVRAALLHRREARLPGSVEGHDLAVDDRVGRAQGLAELLGDEREPLRQVVAPARDELGVAAADVGERPIAVPLRLEQPVAAARQLLRQGREHRPVDAPTAGGAPAVLALAEDEPVLLVAREVRRDKRPGSVEALAVQPHRETAVASSPRASSYVPRSQISTVPAP